MLRSRLITYLAKKAEGGALDAGDQADRGRNAAKNDCGARALLHLGRSCATRPSDSEAERAASPDVEDLVQVAAARRRSTA